MKEAVLVVDMINDFVYDKFGSEGAKKIIPNLKNLLKSAKKSDKIVIYAQDNHSEKDPEMDVWGEHAMEGEKGSETVDEIRDLEDILVKKTTYNPFFKTELDRILKENNIEKIIIAGVSTDICVQHTAGAAFLRGYDVIVLKDCTASMSKDKHESALDYIKNIYGAEITNSKDIIERWNE